MRTLSRIALALLVMLAAGAAFAQDTGSVRGNVADTTGAIVPGATVTLQSEATKFSRNVVTDAKGDYYFGAVSPGVYTITVEIPGFTMSSRKGMRISQREAAGYDIVLEVGRGDMPAAAAIPWLSGMLGSALRILPGNVLGEDRSATWEEMEALRLDQQNPWFKKYVEFAQTLVRHSSGRHPVSHGALVGPCDILGELRGHTQSILDIMEQPERAMKALWRATSVFDEVTAAIWKHLPLWHGGYFDGMYQLWAPGPITRMRMDSLDARGLYLLVVVKDVREAEALRPILGM